MSSFIGAMDNGIKALLYSKFSTLLGLVNINYDVIFQPKEVALRKRSERMGKDVAEFISYWRNGVSFDKTRRISPVAREGILLEYTDAGKTDIITAKAIPVTMDYEFWVWSTDFGKLQDIVDLYMFWIHADPNLNVVLNNRYPLEMDLQFTNVTDESYTATQYDKGTLYVHKFGIKLEGWIFQVTNVKTVIKIIISVYDNQVSGNYEIDDPRNILLYTETITFTP